MGDAVDTFSLPTLVLAYTLGVGERRVWRLRRGTGSGSRVERGTIAVSSHVAIAERLIMTQVAVSLIAIILASLFVRAPQNRWTTRSRLRSPGSVFPSGETPARELLGGARAPVR